MSIALIIKTGEGALYPNHDKRSEKDPALVGFLEIPLDEQKKNKLRLDIAVWLKNNGKDFYSLSVGGIPATLFKEEKKKTATSPDYAGSFGIGREMRIAGWRKTSEGGKPYISIAVTEKTNSQADQAPADDQVPTPPQGNQPPAGQPTGQAEGVPGFDFI